MKPMKWMKPVALSVLAPNEFLKKKFWKFLQIFLFCYKSNIEGAESFSFEKKVRHSAPLTEDIQQNMYNRKNNVY